MPATAIFPGWPPSGRRIMADIVIINLGFDISFWGMEHCIGLLGKRANLPVACLDLLASLVPDHHEVTLIDEKRRGHRFYAASQCRSRLPHWHEHPGPQGARAPRSTRSLDVMTMVGGPLATVEEETPDELADVVFVGEARRPGRNSCATRSKGGTRAATSSRRRPM